MAVQFHPPAGVPPGLVGTILDEQANPIDVSSTVIDLAVRGYLRIEEVEGGGMFTRTDWNLVRLDPPAGEALLPYERRLLDGIFSTRGDVVALSDLKNTFASTLRRIQSEMYDEVVTRHWFRSSPQLQRGMWQGLGIVLAVIGGMILFYGQGAITALLGSAFTGGAVLGIGLLIAGAIVWILGGKMAAKTAEGSAVLARPSVSRSTSRPPRRARSPSRRRATSSAGTCPMPSSSASRTGGQAPSRRSPRRPMRPASPSSCRPGTSGAARPSPTSAASPAGGASRRPRREPSRPPGSSGSSGFSEAAASAAPVGGVLVRLLVRVSGAPPAGWLPVQRDRRVDQGEVRERLREVADLLSAPRDLFGVQARWLA